MSTIKILCGLQQYNKSTLIEISQKGEVIISSNNIEMLQDSLDQKVNIVVCGTNALVRQRKPIIELAKKAGYVIIGLILDYVMHESGENKVLSTPVIEYPTLDEGFDEIYVKYA